MSSVERAKVATIKAVGRPGYHSDGRDAQLSAAVPTRKWPTCGIQLARDSNEAAVDRYDVAKSTQGVSAQRGDGLDHKDRGRNVSTEVRKRSEGLGQPDNC